MDNDEVSAVLQACEAGVKELRSILAKVDDTKLHDWQGILDHSTRAQTSLAQSLQDCKDHLDACSFGLGKCQGMKTKMMNDTRYQHSKVSNRLVAGGMGRHMAKTVVLMLEQPLVSIVPGSDFDPTTVTYWGDSHPLATTLHGKLKGETFVKKKETLTKLALGNPQWGGCTGKLKVGDLEPLVGDSLPKELKPQCFGEEGAQPWLCTFKGFRFRCGPSAWPLAGFGSIVLSDNQDAMTSIIALPIASLIGKGICCADFPNFAEQPMGQAWLKENGVIVTLVAGSCCWIPFGWLALPLLWEQQTVSSKEKLEPAKEPAKHDAGEEPAKHDAADQPKVKEQCAHLLVMTIFDTELAAFMSELVHNAVMSWNTDYIGKFQDKMWVQRMELIKKFGTMYKPGSV